MSAGFYDVQGIWQHGEDDAYATFSQRLNKGQESISTRVAQVDTRLEHVAYREAAGLIAHNAIAAGAAQTVTITFPVGRFSVPPILLLSPREGRVSPSVTALSAASATVFLGNWTSGGAAAASVDWRAVQMETGAAAG